MREGRSGGGISYGYALVPGDVGARSINEAQAEVVRRIFGAYAGGAVRGPSPACSIGKASPAHTVANGVTRPYAVPCCGVRSLEQ